MDVSRPLQICVVAIPDGAVSTLFGVFDVLRSLPELLNTFAQDAKPPLFSVELVSTRAGSLTLTGGVTIDVPTGVDDEPQADIVIVPSVYVGESGWVQGRYPELVDWLTRMNHRGALLCSACSGVFLIAETGLLDRQAVTVHWMYADLFAASYPDVDLYPDKSLVVSGEREELVSSGASTSWHDLLLYLVLRHAGHSTAQMMAKFFALQWHRDGLAPYAVFQPTMSHGDTIVREAQAWLQAHFNVSSPVQQLVQRSGLPERTFKRRFSVATGHSPLDYTQRIRIEAAKRQLEQTNEPVDEIAWAVGYEDPAFFRRLFKRTTGISPSAYRRTFQLPVAMKP